MIIFKIYFQNVLHTSYKLNQVSSQWGLFIALVVTTEAQTETKGSPCVICGEQSGTGMHVFLTILWFSPACHHSTNSQYSSVIATDMYIRPNQPSTFSQSWSTSEGSVWPGTYQLRGRMFSFSFNSQWTNSDTMEPMKTLILITEYLMFFHHSSAFPYFNKHLSSFCFI
jgi:hypothetical protein